MQSEPKTPEIDPRDVGIAPETEPPGRIYKQVVREVLARIDQRLADIERRAVTEPAEEHAGLRAPLRNRLKRGSIGLLVLVTVAVSVRRLVKRGPTRMGGAMLLFGGAVVCVAVLSYLAQSF